MKKTINFFGIPLTILLSVSLLLEIIIAIQLVVGWDFYSVSSYGSLTGASCTVILLIALWLSIIYFVIGIVTYIFNAIKNRRDKSGFAKRMVFRGLLGIAISLVGFFLLSFILSFSGLMLGCLSLPCMEGSPCVASPGC